MSRSDRDVTRVVRSWLDEGVAALPDRVLDAVLDQLPSTPQRRSWWTAWRRPNVNNFLRIGLAAIGVVVIAVIAINLLPSSPAPGGEVPESVPPSEAAPSVEASTSEFLPEGPFVVTSTDDPVQVTVNIASSGWVHLPEVDGLSKDDDGLAPAETVGVVLLAWTWPAGTGFNVYGDPCHWSTTIPETPVTTVDEIAAALAVQPSRDATAPVDVTLGGYSGKQITLHVPDDIALDSAGEFADCDQTRFASYGTEGDPEPGRYHQGPSQIDELWILDVGGSIVILDAVYGPAVPADLVEELRTMAESATFEAP
jgi:hypothetical protein